jgi:uncharacterized repeat protein (TIGR03843 family)
VSVTDALELLAEGDIELIGRMPWSSNATFLVEVRHGERLQRAVYKPLRGERPLWDFEPGLHRREVAAYRLSASMGVDVVPPTVLRDGPLGEGSVQWFVDARFDEHYFTLLQQRPDLHDQLRTIAVFDFVANNTDRKGGHCLLDADDRVWAIDNGLCFAADFRLRTVIWEFGGEPLPPSMVQRLESLVERVPLDVATLLGDDEVTAIGERAEWLVELGTFPVDQTGRRYPYPLI